MKSSSRLGGVLVLILGLVAVAWWLQRDEPSASDDDVATAGVAGTPERSTSPGTKRPRRQSTLAALSAPKASVSGTVRAQSGQILQGARVCAFVTGDASDKPREPSCVRTTADGRYLIENLRPGQYDVAASAAGHLPGRFRPPASHAIGVRVAPGQQRGNVDIELRPGGVEVTGTVRDISGGVIPAAQVRSGYVGRRSGTAPSVVFADDDGRFSIWVERGTASLKASAEGYGTETQRGRAPGTHFQLFLTPESVVVGRVLDIATGEPVEGASVSVQRSPPVLSDATGTFRIDGLAPGAYKPTATADEGYGEAEVSVHLGLGETSEELVINLHPAATVSGLLLVRTEDQTRPCENGSASLTPIPNVASRYLRGRVEADGQVRIRGVLPGRYEITASCTGYAANDTYGEIDISDASVDGLVWEVTRGLAIRGRVLGDAEVRRSVTVQARSTGGAARSKTTWVSTRDIGAQGEFELTGLEAGTYRLELYGRDVPQPEDPIKVEVPEGQDVEGLELELLPSGTIVGNVEDERGNPITTAEIRAQGPGRSWSMNQVADDGTFEVRGLRGGEYRVKASLNWSDTLRKPGTTDDDVQGELVSVEPGGTAEVTLVVESRGHSISGVVVDDTGRPVPDAFVRAERLSDSKGANAKRAVRKARWGGWNEQPNMTDTDGSFTVEGLSEGTYTVRAFRKGGGEGHAENVGVDSDGVSIQLALTGRIEGTVTTATGSAPERFELRVRDETTGFSRSDSFFATDGRFVMDELPPGTFLVSATSADGSGDTEVSLESGVEQVGVSVELQKLVSVTGKIVDLETGEPVGGLQVSMGRKKSGSFNFRTGGGDKRHITDDNGEYTLEAVPVGPVTVTVIPKQFFRDDADYGFTRRNIVVEDGHPFAVKTIEVVRRRAKKSEDVGDLGYTIAERDPGVEWSERQLKIGFVRPGGPAAAAGLEAGATIVSVDGHDVTGERTQMYGTLVRVPVGTTLRLGLDSGGTVELTTTKKP